MHQINAYVYDVSMYVSMYVFMYICMHAYSIARVETVTMIVHNQNQNHSLPVKSHKPLRGVELRREMMFFQVDS